VILQYFENATRSKILPKSIFWAQTVPKPRDSTDLYQNRFVGPAIHLLKSLALHLKFHLRVFLEHLSVALPQELRHPFIRYTAGA
jgi:hypothetical protein